MVALAGMLGGASLGALAGGTSTSPAATAEWRGFVSEGIAGRLLFEPCGTTGPKRYALVDASTGGALVDAIEQVRQVMHAPERALYVELRGDAQGEKLTARALRRAIGHVVSCDAAPPRLPAGLSLFAEGRAPAFRLMAGAQGTRLEQPGQKPRQFAALKAESRAAGDGKAPANAPASATAPAASATAAKSTATRRYAAAASTGAPALQVEVAEQACTDEAAETAYGARVVASLGTLRMEGCAARF